jgi:hypothetical protein
MHSGLLYHCTQKKNLPTIMASGLSAEKSESSLKAVFLSDCPFLTEGYSQQRPESEHVVLTIDLAALDPSLLGPDNYELQDWLEGDGGEQAVLVGVTHWSEATWEQSLEWCNQVAYSGVIAPSAIRPFKDKRPTPDQSAGMSL